MIDMETVRETAAVWLSIGFKWTLIVAVLVLLVVSFVALWRLFVRAGHPGYAALIPGYNLYVMLEIAGRSMLWLAVAGALAAVYVFWHGINLSGVVRVFDYDLLGFVQIQGYPPLDRDNFIGDICWWTLVGLWVLLAVDFARRFGRSLYFGLGLGVLPIVFLPILGFRRGAGKPEPAAAS